MEIMLKVDENYNENPHTPESEYWTKLEPSRYQRCLVELIIDVFKGMNDDKIIVDEKVVNYYNFFGSNTLSGRVIKETAGNIVKYLEQYNLEKDEREANRYGKEFFQA